MDSDSYIDEEEDMMVFQKRGEKHMKLSETAEKKAAEITENSQINIEINGHLDPHNRSRTSLSTIKTSTIQFDNFFVKNKFKDERITAFQALRQLLQDKGFKDIRKISDKEEDQVMVIRVIQKVENALNVFLIEDQDTQAKIHVREGLLWIGMIAAVQAKWQDGMYKLDKIIDLSEQKPATSARLATDLQAYRIIFVKGAFRPKFGNDDEGIMILSNEIKKLKKFNMSINCVVIMGPLLAKSNRSVQNCSLQKTFEEEYQTIIHHIRSELNKINSNIELFIMPSTDDVTSLYPLPQPAYETDSRIDNVRFISNPSTMDVQGRRSHCKIDLVNYDILKYIDTYKGGKATKDLRQQNLETYLKQPFLLNNTLSDDPFDEVNMGGLYNSGKFGDLVIFSSQNSPPFVNEIKGRIVLNIGSLGVDYHYTGNHYMAIASIYEGQGPAVQRIKIETISCV